MEFNIPKSFMLMAQTITVHHQDNLVSRNDSRGEACYRENKIILQTSSDQMPLTNEQLGRVFLHELVHHILYECQEESDTVPLYEREILVHRIAGLLHQALTTMKY